MVFLLEADYKGTRGILSRGAPASSSLVRGQRAAHGALMKLRSSGAQNSLRARVWKMQQWVAGMVAEVVAATTPAGSLVRI